MGYLFDYKVVVPERLDDLGFNSLLASLGSQGWELFDVEVQSNFIILRQKKLPAGCLAAAGIVIQRFLDSFGGR